MASIEESAVYEFYEGKFRELQDRDGAYYPSKHDPEALLATAEYFSMPRDVVSRIYDEFSSHAANLEMSKVKKMPIALQKKFFQQRAHDIFCNNHDLPYFKMEGEASSELSNALDILHDEYKTFIETIAGYGWTIPLSIDIRDFNSLLSRIDKQENVDDFFHKYYNGGNFRLMCRKARIQLPTGAQKNTFDECVNAYEQGMFNVCRTALLTVLEGVVSSFNSDAKDVRVMHVCEAKANEEKAAGRHIKSLCWLSMYEFVKILYQKSDFSGQEPTVMNRHWIEHGRTSRDDDGLDCLKIFCAIATISFIVKSSNASLI